MLSEQRLNETQMAQSLARVEEHFVFACGDALADDPWYEQDLAAIRQARTAPPHVEAGAIDDLREACESACETLGSAIRRAAAGGGSKTEELWRKLERLWKRSGVILGVTKDSMAEVAIGKGPQAIDGAVWHEAATLSEAVEKAHADLTANPEEADDA